MEFRSKLLQRPIRRSGATLDRIYKVYRSPDGHIEGEDQDLTNALQHRDAILRPESREVISGNGSSGAMEANPSAL